MGIFEQCFEKMSQMDKVCMVCGDKALGYNFNAVTCESCKAFFRRNALSDKSIQCPFNDSCDITVVTRRFCQRCRLQKCFKIGMRKEYIMTEEDKLLKRRKIEQNRAKRKSKTSINDCDEATNKMKKESDIQSNDFWTQESLMDQLEMSPGSANSECLNAYPPVPSTLSNSSMSPTSSIGQYTPQISQQQSPPIELPYANSEASVSINTTVSSASPIIANPISSTTSNFQVNNNQVTLQSAQPRTEYPTKESSTSDIVNFFLDHPSESSNYINHLMSNQKTAMEVTTKIIQSQKDAMRMIGHLIGSPGDALKMISKIMNSPYHALTVFTKFMASPTDALEIIAKCVNSPSDVLQFIQQLMSEPENAIEIVNRFMNAPAEAIKMLNDMVDSTTKMDCNDLTNLMTSTNSSNESNEVKSNEFTANDIVTDTLYCTKSTSSPTIRNKLESTHGETSRTSSKTIPTVENSEKVPTFEAIHARSNTLEAIINDAIKIEYNLNGRETSINRELNDTETAKLNELIVAYKALFVPLDENLAPLLRERHEFANKVRIRSSVFLIY